MNGANIGRAHGNHGHEAAAPSGICIVLQLISFNFYMKMNDVLSDPGDPLV